MNSASASVPIQAGSTLAAERATPCLITAGNVAPTGPVQSKCVDQLPTTSATASGVAGCGVRIRLRSVGSSPVAMSTGAPLMPVPPMSMPKACPGCGAGAHVARQIRRCGRGVLGKSRPSRADGRVTAPERVPAARPPASWRSWPSLSPAARPRWCAPAATRLRSAAKSTPTDLVTDVDRATEAGCIERLARGRPDDAVLGEEGGAPRGRAGVRWLLDPIDGTVNFVLGIPHYAVSVAAELDGVVVAGAVCNPVSGELFQGAHRGRSPGRRASAAGVRRDVPLSRAVVGTGFSYDPRGTHPPGGRPSGPCCPGSPTCGAWGPRRSTSVSWPLGGSTPISRPSSTRGTTPPAVWSPLRPVASSPGSGVAHPSERLYAAAPPALAADFFALLESEEADLVTNAAD